MEAAASSQYMVGAQADNLAIGEKVLDCLDRRPILRRAIQRHHDRCVADVEVHVAGRDDLAVPLDQTG
jgi:hypothetical protein